MENGYVVLMGRTHHTGKKVADVMMDGDNIKVFKTEDEAEDAARESHYFSTYGYQIVTV